MKKLSLILLALIALTQTAWAQDVNYIECSWTGSNTGGHVVQTTKTLADGSYTTLANNSGEYPSLSGGWYVVASNCVYMSRIVINGNVNIVVMDGTELYCVQGIQIKDGSTLTIYAQSDGDGMGSVECHGGDVHNGNGDDAALGGNKDEVGGYLVIHGGNIWAHANHNNAAGIGGGNHKSGMRGITIWGGTIDAYGKNSGAGIGAGQQNEVATPVTIYGGTITAKSKRYGAGIGGGEDCGNGTIKIYGGTVNATGGQYGAGIGGGQGGSMGNPVYIYGGNVTTTGGECAAGIGGGENYKGGGNQEAAVYIYGGTVNATGGKHGAGIGGGDEGSGGPVYIYDGTVNATCSQYAAGIGGGYLKSNGTIRIYGGTVTADAGDMETCGAGIGTGCSAQMEYPIYIHGGIVRAYAGSGAGIGGGGHKEQDSGSEFKEAIVPSHNYSQIIIYGGDVYAESQNSECAAIGGGSLGDGGTIKIYGGNVEAKTYFQGASIGAGTEPDAPDCHTDIYIYGGTVKAWAPKNNGFGDASGQCIGVGYDDNSGLSCTGNITLGETMKVYKSSDGTTAASSAREEACRAESGYVLVSECEHSFTYSEYDYQHHKRSTCPYCKIESDYEFHTYGSDGHTCTKCGYNASDPKTLTFYEANAGGTGYEVTTTETHQYLTKCKLPSYTNVPSRLAFEGWVKVDEAPGDNEALTVVTDEQAASMTIYKSGDTYTVEADAIFKAVYKNGWDGEGSGTEADPYIISTIADFNQLASITASCYYYDGKYFRMDADLDFTGESFTPVGNSTKPFKGILDGEGHSISGIYVETADTYKGLFGIVNGTVKNLTLTNSTFKANTNVGGIVCENNGTIENCHVTSSVTIGYYSGNGGNFGGIVGSNYGTVEGCTSAATVDGMTKGRVGGIVGYNEGTLKNSLYYGNNVINGECVGAIVGWEHEGTLTSNYYVPWSGGPKAIVKMFSSDSEDVSGATAGYTVTSGTNGLTLDFGEATTTYDNGIRVYGFGLSYDGVLYSGNGQQVTFTPKSEKQISDLTVSSGTLTDNGNGTYTLTMPAEDVTITATLSIYTVTLYDNGTYYPTNAATIAAHDDHLANVTLNGHTLYKDGNWNTLSLPFNIDEEEIAENEHPLHGATIMKLDTEGWYDSDGTRHDAYAEGYKQTSFDGTTGTLHLYFQTVTEMSVGQPYLVKWASGDNISNPKFYNVEIKHTDTIFATCNDDRIGFAGNYDPVESNYLSRMLQDAHNPDNRSFHAGIFSHVEEWYTDAEFNTPAATIPFDANTGQVTLYSKTVSHAVAAPTSAWNSENPDGWVFIASPVITSEDMEPEDVSGLVAENEDDYDLYRLNPSNTKWENWKEHEGNAAAGFCLENGRGYLYARNGGTTLVFTGRFNTKDKDTIPLSQGFNLVGNPFTVAANINKPYYTLNSDGSAVQTATSSDPIPPCHGVIVQATIANDSVVFTKVTQQSTAPNNSGLNIALTQTNTRGNALLDNAIVSFNEGSQLGKFYFGTQNANIYIPQGNQDYAIAFSEGQGEMPLNFKATEDGTYMITVHPENVEMAYLHLIDNLTGADVDLLGRGDSTPPTYTFTAKTTDYESRFRLVFSVCGDADGDNAPFAFISNGNIIITGITGDACNASLQVIDVMGRIVRCRDAVPASLPTTGLVPGVYVLRLINGENSKIQKIVIQ